MNKTIIFLGFAASLVCSQTQDSTYQETMAALKVVDTKLTTGQIQSELDHLGENFASASKEETIKPAPIPWKELGFSAMTLITWAAMGINEGQKWRQEGGGDIDFMWKDDYHLYRGIHNIGIVGMPLIALTMDRNKSSIKWVVGSNLLGWGLYEMALDYAERRSVVTDKPEFRLLSLRTVRPDALACFGLSVLGTVGLSYTF